MNRILKNVLSVVLSAVMTLGLMSPLVALASEEDVTALQEHRNTLAQSTNNDSDFNSMQAGVLANSIMDGHVSIDSGGEWKIDTKPGVDDETDKAIIFDSTADASNSPRMVFVNKEAASIVEISFDFYFYDFSVDRQINFKMNESWISDRIDINQSGYVSASGTGTANGKTIGAMQWHNLSLLFDCNADKMWFMLDDQIIYYNKLDVDYSLMYYYEFKCPKSKIALDNISFKSYLTRPTPISVVGTGDVVEIAMNTDMAEMTSENGSSEPIDFIKMFELYLGEEKTEITNAEYIKGSKKFKITTKDELISSAVYTIKLNENLVSVNGISVAENTSFTFKTDAASFDITDVNFESGKITAKAVNTTDEQRTAVMVVVGRDADGKVIFTGSTEKQNVLPDETEMVLEIPDNVEACEVIFIDSWDTCKPVKNYIYGVSDVVAPEGSATGEDFVTASYDFGENTVSFTGKLGNGYGKTVLISFADDENAPEEGTSLFSETDKPIICKTAVTGENGAFAEEIKLPDDFENGKYYVYLSSEQASEYTKIIVFDTQGASQVLNMCNTSEDADELSGYLSENNRIELVGLDADEISSYIGAAAAEIIKSRPSGGYALGELVKEIKTAIAKSKLKNGESADSVMKEYSELLGVSYRQYAALEPDTKIIFDVLLQSRAESIGSVTYNELLVISRVRAGATSWSTLQEFVIANAEEIGIEADSINAYNLLSASNRAQVFKNIKDECANALSLDEITECFEKAVSQQSEESNTTSSGNGATSSGNGATSSGKGTKGNAAVTGNPLPEVPKSKTYTDITGHFAQEAVDFLSAKNIIGGYPDSTFRPEGNITRAEFAKLIALAFGINSDTAVSFNDISKSDWFYHGVSALAANGIILGDGAKFYPDNNITRQDAALIISRAMEKAGMSFSGKAEFEDKDEISDYAAEDIGKIAFAGIITGYENRFMPKNNIKRGEAAVMIYRAFKLKEKIQ